MTVEKLRKEIDVRMRVVNMEGISIHYSRLNSLSELDYFDLHLTPQECAIQLSAIGSIVTWYEDNNGLQIRWEERDGFYVTWGWKIFCRSFTLSQWEALTLVISHEYEKSKKYLGTINVLK